MNELKLEVGKKYVNRKDFIVDIIFYDYILGEWIGRYQLLGKGTYIFDSYNEAGGARNGICGDIIKEYKEPKTVSGYAIVYENTYDDLVSDIFETKKEAENSYKRNKKKFPTLNYIGIIHLDNVEIQELENDQ